MKNRKLICLRIIFLSGQLIAQNDTNPSATTEKLFFQSAPFCKPFISEVESNLTKLEVDYSSNSSEYDLSGSNKKYKTFQSTSIGVDFPIYLRYHKQESKPKYGFAISVPLSFHLWWDPLEQSTSPVLSTDYHVSLINFKYIHFFQDKFLKNVSLKFAPFNHESTHIGDELTTYREKEKYPITRVNVSYEYSEMSLTLNDANGDLNENHSIKFGMIYRVNGVQDFYTMTSLDGDSTLIKPTHLKSEFYLEYQWTRSKGILTSKNWVNILSAELRNKIAYKYPNFICGSNCIENTGLYHSRVNSLNIYYGWKYKRSHCPTIGLYLHAYAGVNPHGQFRNQTNFRTLGFSLVLEQ